MTTFSDPDAAIAKIQRDIAEAQERALKAHEVKGAIDQVRGRARSARGEVAVEVDVTGRLLDLTLSDDAMAQRPADLAFLIRETVATAARDAGTQAIALTDDVYGEGSAISAKLREELHQRGAGA